ncbi:MAG: DUF433 domain-containing protein [Clostridia bacterium]
MLWEEHIAIDPAVGGGQPVIRGTRVTLPVACSLDGGRHESPTSMPPCWRGGAVGRSAPCGCP